MQSSSLVASSISWHVRILWPVLPHPPQCREVDGPASAVPPSPDLTPGPWLFFSFRAAKRWASSTVSDPPACIRVRLAVRRFERAWLAFSSVRTLSCRRVTSWAISSAPFASCLTAEKIGVGELPWCCAIRPWTCSDCKIASADVCGVWETHGSASGRRGPVGVGVRNLTSSFDKTAWGSYGTKPDPRKPALMLSGVMALRWADLKATKNSNLVMWVIHALMRSSISRLYARFSALKHPTSSG